MLYIFVEGPDDYNYFEKIFGESFGEYKIIKYASMPQVKLNNFIRTIPSNLLCEKKAARYVQLCTRQQIEWRFLSVAVSPFYPNVVFLSLPPPQRRCPAHVVTRYISFASV